MKKKRIINVLIVVILVALLSVCIGLIFGMGTYSAKAEETSIEVPQDSADESEAPVFTEKTYRYAHSETKYVLITLTSDTECTIEMFDGENTGSRKIMTTYKQTGGELTVYYMGDVLGRFIINADNTLTEAEETPAPDPEFDLDAFLAWVQKYADQAGIGSEYAKAVEAIKAAASEKQVTISTVASVAQLAVFVIYLIYTNVKNGKLKKQLKEVSEKLDLQLKGTNGLIDESNHNGQTGEDTKKDVEALKKALANFTKAFMQFADRTNIGAASKEAIKHDLNAAIREIDGETKEKADEEDQAL